MRNMQLVRMVQSPLLYKSFTVNKLSFESIPQNVYIYKYESYWKFGK